MEHNGYTITVFNGDIISIPRDGFIVFGPEHQHKIARVYGGSVTELTKNAFTHLDDAVSELTGLTKELLHL